MPALPQLAHTYSLAPRAQNVGATAQSAAYIVVPSINGTVASAQPTWNAAFLGLTIDGTNLWQNFGPTLRPWGVPAPSAAPTVANAINTSLASPWVASTYFMPVLPLIELGGFIYKLTVPGTTAGSVPSFVHTTPGVSTTTDGGCTWLYISQAARQTSHAYAVGDVILVTWTDTITIPGTQTLIGFNQITGAPIYVQGPPTTQTTTYTAFFQATIAGLSGGGADSTIEWSSALNTTVADNAVTWQNIGLAVTRSNAATTAPVITSGALVAGNINNSQAVSNVSTVLDINGSIETVVTAGETGTATPTWATAFWWVNV